MSAIARYALWHGRPEPPDRPLVLHAGPVRVLLDGPDLRHVRIGGAELVQRVYVAVRDAPWNTIPARTSDWVVAHDDDRFRATFAASHRHEDIAFDWKGVIEGTPDGVIRYELDGVCHGSFRYSKIGFNVHHALDGAIGRHYRAETATGEVTGVLSSDIDPQRIVDGTLTGMFAPYSEIAIEVVDGLEAIIALEGDLLELQDPPQLDGRQPQVLWHATGARLPIRRDRWSAHPPGAHHPLQRPGASGRGGRPGDRDRASERPSVASAWARHAQP